MASKAEKSPTTTRRQLLAAAPAALVAGSIPAGATAPGITPALAEMIAAWKTARAKFLRLNAIDGAARALYHSTAPEIPERIVAQRQGGYFPREFEGYLRYACRADRSGEHTLRPSWWQKQIDEWKLSWPPKWLIETRDIAIAFDKADEAAYDGAGCGVTNDDMEAAVDIVNELECAIEGFEAQSFADIAAIARISEVVVSDGSVHEETWQGLLANIFRVAERQGV